MKTTTSLALLVATFAAACSPAPPPPAKPPTPPETESLAVPACPDTILPGGDPIEAESFEGKKVVRVCVLGPDAESRAAAQKVIELRPSEVFSAERVRSDLEAILKLGTFDDASAYGLRVQRGTSVVLFYTVRDRPKIAAIGFEGAKVLGDATLDAKLPIHKDSPYDPALVFGMAEAVRNEYRSRGYESATVKLVTEPAPGTPPRVTVHVKVDEGPRWHFSKVAFSGNKKVAEADLRKTAGLSIDQPYVEDEVERATVLLSAVYYDRGFIQVQVKQVLGTADATGALPLTFEITEGEAYSIGALHVTKLGKDVEKELLDKVIKSRPKQTFSRAALVSDIQHVQEFFEKKGQHVEVTPLTDVNVAKKSVDLTLEIQAR